MGKSEVSARESGERAPCNERERQEKNNTKDI